MSMQISVPKTYFGDEVKKVLEDTAKAEDESESDSDENEEQVKVEEGQWMIESV